MAGLGLILLRALVAAGVASADTVRVWEATEDIPTYQEGPPDVNPPFDLFSSIRFNYPYTIRENLSDQRATRSWRTPAASSARRGCGRCGKSRRRCCGRR